MKFGEILKSVDLVQFAGMDQAHEQIAHPGPVLSFVEVRVLAVQNNFFQSSLTDVVIERRSGMSQEQSQLIPMFSHVADRLAQTAVGFDLSVLDLSSEPFLNMTALLKSAAF